MYNSIQKSDQPAGLPAVYQVYRREALRAKGFRRFLFAVFGAGLTKACQGHFLREKPAGFSPPFIYRKGQVLDLSLQSVEKV